MIDLDQPGIFTKTRVDAGRLRIRFFFLSITGLELCKRGGGVWATGGYAPVEVQCCWLQGLISYIHTGMHIHQNLDLL